MKTVGVFGLALATSALLGIILLGTVARWLTLNENAAFVAIWGVAFSGSSIVSVIEQDASRQVTLSQARRQPVPGSVGQLAILAVLGAAAALVVLTFLPMGTRVFGGSLWLVALTFVSLTGFSVQFLVRGREKIGVASDTGNNGVAEDLLAERDLLFCKTMENESTLTMTPGSFAVFLPTDVHRPGCAFDQPEAIRKVVVKVRVSLLAGA